MPYLPVTRSEAAAGTFGGSARALSLSLSRHLSFCFFSFYRFNGSWMVDILQWRVQGERENGKMIDM